jgi:hypothetical protein
MTTGSATQTKVRAPVLSENKVPQGLRAGRQNSEMRKTIGKVNPVPTPRDPFLDSESFPVGPYRVASAFASITADFRAAAS